MASHVYQLSSTLLLDPIEQYLRIWALIKASAFPVFFPDGKHTGK